MSDTGWRDRRIKSFDYAALKQDLEDIESRLQRARESTNAASMWPDQRKAQSLQFLMGAPHSPIERNQSPDTLTSSGKVNSYDIPPSLLLLSSIECCTSVRHRCIIWLSFQPDCTFSFLVEHVRCFVWIFCYVS